MGIRIFKIVLFLLLAGCVRETVKKPENLIPEHVMKEIIYDMAILNATRNTGVDVLRANHLLPERYVYEKYQIDSLQFAESTKYYASDPESYALLYEEIEMRLKQLKDSLEEIDREKNEKPIKKP